ncbi:hypothetical protein V2J09_013009 [Rumex salicifolius]
METLHGYWPHGIILAPQSKKVARHPHSRGLTDAPYGSSQARTLSSIACSIVLWHAPQRSFGIFFDN